MRDSPHLAAPVPPDRQCVALLTKDPRRVCRRWARVRGHGGEVPRRWSGSGCSRRQTLPLPRRTRVKHGGQGLASGPQVPPAYLAVADLNVMCRFARVVKGVDLRSTAGNCAWARTPQLTGPPSLQSAACMVHPTLPHLTWQTVHHSPRKRSAVRLQTLGRHPGAWRRGATQVVCVQLQSGTEATTASKDPCRTREPRLCCGPTGVPNFASNGWPDGYVSVCPSG